MLRKRHIKDILTRKRIWILVTAVILLVCVIYPYTKVVVLTHFYSDEFMNASCNAYFNAKEVKVYDYEKEEHAKCLILADNGMYGAMVEYEWDSSQNEWKYVIYSCVWTRYGGNAHEFYWPLFYGKEYFSSGW
jgi:hypothetical protein